MSPPKINLFLFFFFPLTPSLFHLGRLCRVLGRGETQKGRTDFKKKRTVDRFLKTRQTRVERQRTFDVSVVGLAKFFDNNKKRKREIMEPTTPAPATPTPAPAPTNAESQAATTTTITTPVPTASVPATAFATINTNSDGGGDKIASASDAATTTTTMTTMTTPNAPFVLFPRVADVVQESSEMAEERSSKQHQPRVAAGKVRAPQKQQRPAPPVAKSGTVLGGPVGSFGAAVDSSPRSGKKNKKKHPALKPAAPLLSSPPKKTGTIASAPKSKTASVGAVRGGVVGPKDDTLVTARIPLPSYPIAMVPAPRSKSPLQKQKQQAPKAVLPAAKSLVPSDGDHGATCKKRKNKRSTAKSSSNSEEKEHDGNDDDDSGARGDRYSKYDREVATSDEGTDTGDYTYDSDEESNTDQDESSQAGLYSTDETSTTSGDDSEPSRRRSSSHASRERHGKQRSRRSLKRSSRSTLPAPLFSDSDESETENDTTSRASPTITMEYQPSPTFTYHHILGCMKDLEAERAQAEFNSMKALIKHKRREVHLLEVDLAILDHKNRLARHHHHHDHHSY